MNIVKIDFSPATDSLDIFISGCNGEPKCKNCHNPELWDYDKGEKYSEEVLEKILWYDNDFNLLIDNIFIMGGEPLDQEIYSLRHLLKNLKEKTNKKIWLFTRYDLDKIPNNIIINVDYIKSGRYIPELATDNNIQYGIKLASSNQIIYKKIKDNWSEYE